LIWLNLPAAIVGSPKAECVAFGRRAKGVALARLLADIGLDRRQKAWFLPAALVACARCGIAQSLKLCEERMLRGLVM